MRMMLGKDLNNPSLLVDVPTPYDPNCFEFWVVNGCWKGRFINNEIYVADDKESTGDKVVILSTDQRLLKWDYASVFENFDKWVKGEPIDDPEEHVKANMEDFDDDIPF
jgi:hypothetical protein